MKLVALSENEIDLLKYLETMEQLIQPLGNIDYSVENTDISYDTKEILDIISELVVHYDENMRILWANQAVSTLFSMPKSNLIGETCYQTLHCSDCPCENCPVSKALLSGKMCQSEITTPDDKIWLAKGYPVWDEKTNSQTVFEVAIDITSRKKREEYRKTVQLEVGAFQECLSYLTPREVEVMELVIAGRANKVIAIELGISQKTVEIHRSRMMTKLKTASIADLVRYHTIAKAPI